MKIKSTIALLGLLVPAVAIAENNNIGTCGWGSKLFDGQRGIAPQVLAVTTNGTSGNQTFGISSGTSGCTQDGVVRSTWKTAAYIDGNMNRLARDMSRGEGESVAALAGLLGIPEEEQASFAALLQERFTEIYSSASVSSVEVVAGLRNVLNSNESFKRYAVNV